MSVDVIFYYIASAFGFLTFCYDVEFLIISIIRRKITDEGLRKNFDKTFTNLARHVISYIPQVSYIQLRASLSFRVHPKSSL
jgi:hypothetical protein